MSLTGKQKRFLRAKAHSLSPTVTVGKDGVTDAVHAATAQALSDHELIKVRVLEAAPVDRKEASELLSRTNHAEPVGEVGRIVILYKRHPEKPALRLPRGE